MKNAKRFGVVAAMVAAMVCVCNAQADPINWDAVSSKTYTVPADTTNEVTTAEEFAKVTNLLTKVIFANPNSTLRFTVSTFPDSVTFQGPGTVLMDETVVLDKQNTDMKRSLGEGDSTNFVKFVFAKGVDNGSPTTARYLRCDSDPFSNTAIFFNGLLGTNIVMSRAGGARYDLNENFCISNDWQHMTYILSGAVIRQRGCDIIQRSAMGGDGPSISYNDRVGAWLMEGGKYYTESAGKYNCFYGHYSHVRQTGGLISFGRFAVNNAAVGVGIRPDFVFGGNGVVTIRGKSCPTRPCLFAFMDSVEFENTYSSTYRAFYNLSGGMNGGTCEGTIWAHNGGVAIYSFWHYWSLDAGNSTSGPTNNVFSFNGGLRGFAGEQTKGENLRLNLFGFTPWVRFYENGGGFQIYRDKCYYLRDIEFLEPEGNVVKSITLSDELKNKVFQTPPSVEIWDEGGTGTNAAAVVDYDFDTGRITNITMICKGENYTTPKANLRYKAGAANRLLTTPLDCVVGPEQGGDLTFAATNKNAEVCLYAMTNYTHGALIVDMDKIGVADHGANTKTAYGNFLHLYYCTSASVSTNCTMFPNITNIVLKSGGIDSEYGWGYNHQNDPWGILPKCWKIELYGGHLIGGSARFEDVTIGGEVWLTDHALRTASGMRVGDIRICRSRAGNDDFQDSPGMLTVDVACLTNGITPKVKYGNVRFYCGVANTTLPALAGSTNGAVTVKNWDVLPKNRNWTTILDLTETTVNVPSGTAKGHWVNTPDIVYPEGSEGELLIKWEMNPEEPTKPYRLLARRIANGTMLIFK